MTHITLRPTWRPGKNTYYEAVAAAPIVGISAELSDYSESQFGLFSHPDRYDAQFCRLLPLRSYLMEFQVSLRIMNVLNLADLAPRHVQPSALKPSCTRPEIITCYGLREIG